MKIQLTLCRHCGGKSLGEIEYAMLLTHGNHQYNMPDLNALCGNNAAHRGGGGEGGRVLTVTAAGEEAVEAYRLRDEAFYNHIPSGRLPISPCLSTDVKTFMRKERVRYKDVMRLPKLLISTEAAPIGLVFSPAS